MSSKFSAEVLNHAMRKPSNIRNMSVIAHVDHGKSTLTDSLVSKAGFIAESQAGKKLFTDNDAEEIERGITIKSTAVSMFFELDSEVIGDLKRDGDGFLVNLIDSPGHVDFSSEVTAALRITDGALLVVDVVSGCSVQTETVLRQALSEKIKPVLVINKIDRAILEQKLEPEKLYQRLKSIIEHVNFLISVYGGNNDGETEDNEEAGAGVKPSQKFTCNILDPLKGNVAFTAGKDGWGFTIRQFDSMYKKKTGSSMLKRLWGDSFFNSETKKWQTNNETESQNVERGFNKLILDPIYKALNVCMENNYEQLDEICKKLDSNVKIKDEQKDKFKGKDLMSFFMRKWLPAADAMLELIVCHLPSPLEAQRYRVDHLYEGPADDEAGIAIRECDPNGHLMIYISKMIPLNNDCNSFSALGRVFSGTATSGQTVRIMGPEYKIGSDNSLFIKNLTRCMVMVGDRPLSVENVPCGNIVALGGIDKHLAKSGTITTYPNAHNIRSMKFSVSPVVRVAVEPKDPSDLTKLIEGLKRLGRVDPLVKIDCEKGQCIIAGAGELHLEICLHDLENKYARIAIKTSEPLVTYKETVLEKSDQICLAKSGNKLNRIFLAAEPLPQEFCNDVDDGKININQDKKHLTKYLHETYNFDSNDVKKIWCFGPNQFGPNMLVDMTKGVASSADVTDTICAGFQWGSDEGVLCEENLRGVRFNLMDLQYHSDPAHRKGSQLIPTVRRAMMSAMLTAKPSLYEPVYLVEIQCPANVMGAVYTLINKKRGEIIEERMIEDTLLHNIKAYLPVNESNGFTGDLRQATSGKAFPQCTFDHWQILPGNPFDVSTKAGNVCRQIRQSKGLPETIHTLDYYLDKL